MNTNTTGDGIEYISSTLPATGIFCKVTYRHAEHYGSASTTVLSPLALSDYFLHVQLHFWTHKDGLSTKLSLAYLTRLSTVGRTMLLYLQAVCRHHYHYTGHVMYASKQVVILPMSQTVSTSLFSFTISVF
jgi:hypothetical protein